MAVLEVNGLKKVYTTRFGGSRVQALTNVTFAVERGEYVAIMGESGSGKTTLLNILAALDRPTEGEVFLNGRALSTIGEKEIASFRRQNLGFVFQDFNLLDTFTLQDNIFLPLVLAGKHFPEMQAKLLPLAQQLGIADLLQRSTRTRSPAARSSAPPWRVRSSPHRRFSLRMNPPAHSIPARPTAFYHSLARLIAPVRRF